MGESTIEQGDERADPPPEASAPDLTERVYRRLVEQIPAVTYIDRVDDVSSTLYISPQIAPLLGYSPDEWIGDPELWTKLLHPDDRPWALAESGRTNASGHPFVAEYRMVSRDGRTVWVRDEATLVRDERGAPAFWQGVLTDITDRKHAEQQIAFLAYHDKLTGLPNRGMFEEFLELSIARARRHGDAVAVLYLDLDNFKLVNDSLGHAAGDQLLLQVSERLKEASRDTDLVARLGGDEFLLLLADVPQGAGASETTDRAIVAAETVATRIHEALAPAFSLDATEFYVSASIGISVLPVDADDAAALLRNADAAMYRSKRTGPGGYAVYATANTDPRNRLAIATRLRRAVEDASWVLRYQPIVDLRSGAVTGVEALIRWQREAGDLVPPAEFLPLAEEMGLMERIGEWVVEELCRQAERWRDAGVDLDVAFNLSPRELWHADLVETLLPRFAERAIDPSRVVAEITESAAMTDPVRTQQVILRLRGGGLRFAIDDFGTGYSSLSRLMDLPVDFLKIDRSFVADLPHKRETAIMVRAVIQLAMNLGMTALAEGIETPEQLAFLVRNQCPLGQGFLFSEPVDAEEVGTMVRAGFGSILAAASR